MSRGSWRGSACKFGAFAAMMCLMEGVGTVGTGQSISGWHRCEGDINGQGGLVGKARVDGDVSGAFEWVVR